MQSTTQSIACPYFSKEENNIKIMKAIYTY